MFIIQQQQSVIEWRIVISVGIPAVIAILGWFLGHWLNSRRELSNKRREIRLAGLETAYKRISHASLRDLTPEDETELERFVSEIQMYGTPHQIDLMTDMVKAFNDKKPEVSFDALLVDLRDTLRKELKLEPVSGPVWWLRYKLPTWKAK